MTLSSLLLAVTLMGYGLFLLGYVLYSVYAIHHLNEYGYSGDASQRILRLYLGTSSLITIASIVGILIGLAS